MRYAFAMHGTTSRRRTSRRSRRPLRTLLLVGLALVLLALLLAPGLLGWVVHRQFNGWLAASWPEATVRWQRGWFASRVEAGDGRAHAVFDIRHSPFRIEAPLAARGPLTLADPSMQLDLAGKLDWQFDLHIEARTERIERPGPIAVSAGPARLDFVRERDGAVDLRLNGEHLALDRAAGARLDLTNLAISAQGDGLDPGRLRVTIDATQRGAPDASRLAIRIEGIDRQRASAWRAALDEAVAAPPGTARASLAWVGVASAWEQLARAGLMLHVDPLILDQRAELTGQWQPADGAFSARGRGRLDALERWIVPIAALATAEPPAALRREFALQAEMLARQPGIRIEDERFEIDWSNRAIP